MRSVTIVRHGHREDFVGDALSPTWAETAENPHDPDISEVGIAQATSLGKRLSSQRDVTVLASPFLRTVHTASLVAHELGVQVKVEDGLHEWLHPNGFPHRPALRTLDELHRRFGNVDTGYRSVTLMSYPEMTLGAVVTRAGMALETVLAHHSGNLVLVTHADPLLGFLMAAGIEACRQPVRTCSIYRIEGGSGEWSLAIDGESDHLDGLK